MKRFKHLLVHLGLDGAHDTAAIRYANAISRLSRSQSVEFVHTGPDFTLLENFLSDAPNRTAAWLRAARTAVAGTVRRHFRSPKGCRSRVEVLGGARFQDLLERVRQRDIDLILVGKSDHNDAFVEKLVRKAPCSVMVVPARRSAGYRRILVTTDFSEHSDRALEVALAFARARRLKQLCCFHGYQIPYGHHRTGIPREQFRREVQAWARARQSEQAKAMDRAGVILTSVIEESPVVAQAILHQAEARRSDLLVMGARGKDALSVALLGSTTAEVVRETRIPTLVVKPKGAGRALLDLLLGKT